MLPLNGRPVRLWRVRLAYIDETCRGDLYFVVAVVVGDECIQSLEDGLSEVLKEAARTVGHPISELHGHPIFHGEGEWEGAPPAVRISLYRQAMRAVGRQDVHIFISGVDVRGLAQRYGAKAWHPHDVVLRHLLERVNDHAELRREPALVIADELGRDDRLRHRTTLAHVKSVGTGGIRSSKLSRIVDTIHFAPSQHSRLLQAADLVAFLHQRRLHHDDSTAPREARANDRIWAEIQHRIDDSWIWFPYPVPGRHEILE